MDIDDTAGAKTCEEFTKEFGGENINYIHCDVTDEGSFESKFCECRDY